MKISIPEKVNELLIKLNRNGFEAFIVGGCVRDSILGKTPHDWDICTNAKPDEIKECLTKYHTIDTGIKHGTVSVEIDKEIFEITTYRIDGEYSDNRHPKNVDFTTNIIDDLARRDFTINAIAYNDEKGIVDPYHGCEDLKLGTIRCVGEPEKRFREDALRIIRALRFASVYSFRIDSSTAQAILDNRILLNNVSAERIACELNRLVCGGGAEKILNDFRSAFAVFMPEIAQTFDFEQHTKHHNRDVWRHTTHAVSSIEAEPILRITMLFHDLGKPNACKRDADGTCHFKGHPKYSAIYANDILHRLKYPNYFIDTCLTLIIYHDVRFNGTKKQIKHVMNKIGEQNMALLFKVQRADILAQSEYRQKEKLEAIDLAENKFKEIISEKSCFTLKQLAVNGNDLINMGITEGKMIGSTLKLLLSLVIDEKVENTRGALLDKAKEIVRNI